MLDFIGAVNTTLIDKSSFTIETTQDVPSDLAGRTVEFQLLVRDAGFNAADLKVDCVTS